MQNVEVEEQVNLIQNKRKIDFGKKLKYLREKNQLTQKQLAEQIGYTEKICILVA